MKTKEEWSKFWATKTNDELFMDACAILGFRNPFCCQRDEEGVKKETLFKEFWMRLEVLGYFKPESEMKR